MTRLGVVTLVVDAARDRAARPLKGEFLQHPRLPIREQYLYRLLVNMVWFARNYLNLIALWILIWSYWYPLFLGTMTLSALVHLKTADPVKGPGLKAAQLLLVAATPFCYGVLPPLVSGTLVLLLIFSHALVTPYTDEASTLYEDLTKAGGEESFPAPGTPVTEYTGTNKFGPHQIGTSPSGTGRKETSMVEGGEAGALQGMPPLHLGEPQDKTLGGGGGAYSGGATAGAESNDHHLGARRTSSTTMLSPTLGGKSVSGSAGKRKTMSSRGQPVQVIVPEQQQLPKPIAKKSNGRSTFNPDSFDSYMTASSLPETGATTSSCFPKKKKI